MMLKQLIPCIGLALCLLTGSAHAQTEKIEPDPVIQSYLEVGGEPLLWPRQSTVKLALNATEYELDGMFFPSFHIQPPANWLADNLEPLSLIPPTDHPFSLLLQARMAPENLFAITAFRPGEVFSDFSQDELWRYGKGLARTYQTKTQSIEILRGAHTSRNSRSIGFLGKAPVVFEYRIVPQNPDADMRHILEYWIREGDLVYCFRIESPAQYFKNFSSYCQGILVSLRPAVKSGF